ncbi:hypothetical protein LPB142_14635 [Rhodobacter xanthinilyticus]|uniref:Flavinylation-associated cytochrome domain-containing protein n=1 Tax=Rhodobacter xanthinilyticus TaxID=1850250 RepID=A0A1D9MEY9_9RHOB|nr:DUF4405 domain-containing protein [Rhodobacter xanthinilyticus]AOZ70412.1 hypothetical protein LPB142_14635 [Rhodobacter xanthinilyticus]
MSLRAWATPLVIGAFAIMALTGVLMFFHLDTATMKTVHEWAGLVMVAGALAHLLLNWRAFTTYFRRPLANAIMAAGVIVAGLTFVPNLIPGVVEGAGLGPEVVIRSLGNARIDVLADLAGKAPEALQAELKAAGYGDLALDQTVKSAAQGDGGVLRGILATALVPKAE